MGAMRKTMTKKMTKTTRMKKTIYFAYFASFYLNIEMSGFFRSKPMKYYSLLVPRESAWQVMDALGSLDSLHFVDYDPTLPTINRPFANYIKRCDETVLRIQQIEAEMKRFRKQITYCPDIRKVIRHFKQLLQNSIREKPRHTYFEEIEQEVEKSASYLLDQTRNLSNLQDKQNTLIEYRAVLVKCMNIMGQHFFTDKSQAPSVQIDIRGKETDEIKGLGASVRFNQVVGVINKDDEIRFKRMVFRLTKGNVYMNMVDIEDSLGRQQILGKDDKPLAKVVYIIVFPGGESQNGIKAKLNRLNDSFGGGKYEFPSSQGEYETKLASIEQQLSETRNLIQMTLQEINNFLDQMARCDFLCSNVELQKLYVIRERYLYQNLNYLRMQGSIFCGNFWLSEDQDVDVRNTLSSIQNDQMPSGQIQETRPVVPTAPPTYFKLNEVTVPFQEIVNTYGTPRYQEINPGLFTVVTFPFLFGVMFADIGHGFLLFLLGIYLCLFEPRIAKSDSAFKILLPARYLFALMGFFALYNGFIYNDYLSLSLNLFGSCYELKATPDDKEAWERKPDCTYPFGVDPVWSMAGNQLTFLNSYKMKLSVIIGVVHMTFGILLKGANAIHFKNWIDFFCEFIPQLLFMICTFGFMDFMIIYKWLNQFDPAQAPSIITLLINMVLSTTTYPDPPLWEGSQVAVNETLLIIAFICVPWMLIPKPLILKKNIQQQAHKASEFSSTIKINEQLNQPLIRQQEEERVSQDLDEQFKKDLVREATKSDQVHKAPGGHDEHHDFGEIFVHQVIETIEFVLGSISNTASYLRLWALSLAHGQLADVFIHQTISDSITSGGTKGIVGTIVLYPMFALVTFGVLMLMDVMECFLHALRLHWVEFQNKFFKADGYLFVPFSYQNILSQHNGPKDE